MKDGKGKVTSTGKKRGYWEMLFTIIVVSACIPQMSLSEEGNDKILIKEVINHDNVKNHRDYEYGRYRYPNYEVEGLSELFLIKRMADVILHTSDIKSVEIRNMYNNNTNAFWVKVIFTSIGANKMKVYTRNRIDDRIALEIADTLLVVATVLSPIENALSMPIVGVHVTAIIESFGRVTGELAVVK
jgi:hypothetical protein